MDDKRQTELTLTTQKRIIWEQVEKEIIQAFHLFGQTHKEAEGAFVANESMKGLGLIDALIRKHDVVVCNPPYSGRRNMNEALRNDLKFLYSKKNADLYTVFIDRCLDLISKGNGFCGMVTVHSFMFTSSHEEIRKEIVNNTEIETMAHLGTRTEFDVANKTAQGFSMYAVAKMLKNKIEKASCVYFRLVKENEEEKHTAFSIALADYKEKGNTLVDPHVFILSQEKLKAIPGWPIVYWVSDGVREVFSKYDLLWDNTSKIARPCKGNITGDNIRFLRLFWEVLFNSIEFDCNSHEYSSKSDKRWYPYMKGGSVNKWYGNQTYLINYKSDGKEIKQSTKFGERNPDIYFREGATISSLTVSDLSVRYLPKGFICDSSGLPIIPFKVSIYFLIGILNAQFVNFLIKLINPTVNYQPGDLARIPIPNQRNNQDLSRTIEERTKRSIELKKQIVRKQEISWEFTLVPKWQSGIHDSLYIEKELALLESEVSQGVYQLCQIKQVDIDTIEAELGTLPGKLSHVNELNDPRLKVIEKLYLEKHVPDEVIGRPEQIMEDEVAGESEINEESTQGRRRQKRFLDFEELCLASGFHPETVYTYIVTNNLERPEERFELAVKWVSYAVGILLGRFGPGIKGTLGSGIDNDGSLLSPEKFQKVRQLSVDEGTMVMDSGHHDDLPTRVEDTLLPLLDESGYKRLVLKQA
jgi:hypothetical protein